MGGWAAAAEGRHKELRFIKELHRKKNTLAYKLAPSLFLARPRSFARALAPKAARGARGRARGGA